MLIATNKLFVILQWGRWPLRAQSLLYHPDIRLAFAPLQVLSVGNINMLHDPDLIPTFFLFY